MLYDLTGIRIKKLIDYGLRDSSSMDLEIRFWTVSSRRTGNQDIGY